MRFIWSCCCLLVGPTTGFTFRWNPPGRSPSNAVLLISKDAALPEVPVTNYEQWEEEDREEGLSQSANRDSNDDESLRIYQQWAQALRKALQALDKKSRSLERELEKANQIESTEQRAQLLTAYLYMFQDSSVQSAIVTDFEGNEVELTLDPAFDSASAEANALFQQVRKLKPG